MADLNLADQPVGPVLYFHGQRKKFFLPEGLEPLLEEIAVEVLKRNPENIYECITTLLEAKVQKRSAEAEHEPQQDRRHSWEWRVWSSDVSSVLNEEELRTFVAEFNIPLDAAEHLATVIQAAWRGFHARQDYKKLSRERKRTPSSLWEEWIKESNFVFEGRDMLQILLHYGHTRAEADKAATKIQALFRGHLTRRLLHAPAHPGKWTSELLREMGITRDEAHNQATVIQSNLSRKQLTGLEQNLTNPPDIIAKDVKFEAEREKSKNADMSSYKMRDVEEIGGEDEDEFDEDGPVPPTASQYIFLDNESDEDEEQVEPASEKESVQMQLQDEEVEEDGEE